jgi:hypothetical protein
VYTICSTTLEPRGEAWLARGREDGPYRRELDLETQVCTPIVIARKPIALSALRQQAHVMFEPPAPNTDACAADFKWCFPGAAPLNENEQALLTRKIY